ncbi:MAG: hypothetical protein WDZ75_00965 [Candidatus Paceibacterota bacterium]
MIPRELVEGVQKMLEVGATPEVVQTFLLERGWSESDAHEVFSEIEAGAVEREEKQKEKIKEQTASAVVPFSAVSVPTVISHPSTPKSSEVHNKDTRKDTPAEKVREIKLVTTEKKEEKKAPTVIESERKVLLAPAQNHTNQKSQKLPEQEPEKKVEITKQLDKTPQRELTKKTEEQTLQNKKRENKKEGAGVRERPEREPSVIKPIKVREQDIPDETQETELFEVSVLSSPLALVTIAFSYVKQQFWNLFFLSFMVSVLCLVLYVVLSYIVTAEKISNLWTTIVGGDSSLLLITPLLVLALMSVGVVVSIILLWLPSAYILAFSRHKSSFRKLFVGGFKEAFSLLVSSVFVLLFIISGFILFLIPGFLFAVWFVFAPIITVVERTSPFTALLVSRELVRDHFWDIVWREVFLLIPTAFFALLFILLLSPLALLDTFGLGIGLVVATFVAFAALLFVFAFLLFFFAYHVAFYKEMRTRIQTIKLSGRLARALPLLLIIPMIASLAVAFFVSSLV